MNPNETQSALTYLLQRCKREHLHSTKIFQKQGNRFHEGMAFAFEELIVIIERLQEATE